MNETQSDQTPTQDGYPHDAPALERRAQALGDLVGDQLPPCYGYALFLFEWGPGGEVAWTSNAVTADLARGLRKLADSLDASVRVRDERTRAARGAQEDIR